MTETWQTLVAVMLEMKVDIGGERIKEPCSLGLLLEQHLLFSGMYVLIWDKCRAHLDCATILQHFLTQYLGTSFRFSYLIS